MNYKFLTNQLSAVMMTSLVGLTLIACSDKQNKDQSSEQLASKKVISHQGNDKIVTIENVFPELGFADPHFMVVDETLYVGMGHNISWTEEKDWNMDRWEIWSTQDLRTWTQETQIWPKDMYIGEKPNAWAGDFAQKDGRYYWYFSNRNIDTGVAVANQPQGPYYDALDEPLIPHGLTETHSYDPEIFSENNEHYIIFGAGKYYISRLSDSMLSLADKPKPITVVDEKGQLLGTDDKPALFKREQYYYLVYGDKYAMSENLYGPYEFKGAFLQGEHNNIFKWKGQWYVGQTNYDINIFYRGITLKPVFFNADGTVDTSRDIFPADGGRVWDFNLSSMGWVTDQGKAVNWDKRGFIHGELSIKSNIIESANWAQSLTKGRTLTISLKNKTQASKLKVSFANFDKDKPAYWSYPHIDWQHEATNLINIQSQGNEFVKYTLKLDNVKNIPKLLKRLRLEFVGATSGTWQIEEIKIL